MDKITLPSVEVEAAGQDLKITHRRTGMTTMVSAMQLDRWCIRLLRGELSSPTISFALPEPADAKA